MRYCILVVAKYCLGIQVAINIWLLMNKIEENFPLVYVISNVLVYINNHIKSVFQLIFFVQKI